MLPCWGRREGHVTCAHWSGAEWALLNLQAKINGYHTLLTKRYIQTLSFIILSLADLYLASPLPQTAAPLFDKMPFMVIWNAPTSRCQQLKIPLDFSGFQAITTPAKAHNQTLTLFYKKRLGLFPYIDLQTMTLYNGGIPQRGNLTASLKKAKEEFTHYIPNSSPGLAVLDWEEWLPVFDQNSDGRGIYRELSINYTLQQDLSLTRPHAESKAKQQFQKMARDYMEKTLKLGTTQRPKHLWGYYMYPDCYNYDFENLSYTGQCPDDTTQLNTELLWLWEASTALFPTAYIPRSISGSQKVALFVRHQVQEAVRVAALPQQPYTIPIYMYLRPLLRDQKEHYMHEVDLVRSIGESAALGAAGCVLWGSSYDYNDKTSCEALSTYLSKTLNQYIVNVTSAAHLCSNMLCQGNGRCVRKHYDSDDYLHLNPIHFDMEKRAGTYYIRGKPSITDLRDWAKMFTCQCYADKNCSAKITSGICRRSIILANIVYVDIFPDWQAATPSFS
ncbi:hyaluronidase-5-like [Hoplias malabaricus]|uniref:hyaluronidase-5-like n=1 Tax=Hoplias malabaricus TaxID=27720 RepID=UPI003462B50A